MSNLVNKYLELSNQAQRNLEAAIANSKNAQLALEAATSVLEKLGLVVVNPNDINFTKTGTDGNWDSEDMIRFSFEAVAVAAGKKFKFPATSRTAGAKAAKLKDAIQGATLYVNSCNVNQYSLESGKVAVTVWVKLAN